MASGLDYVEEANAMSVLRSVLLSEARSKIRYFDDGGETTSDAETDAYGGKTPSCLCLDAETDAYRGETPCDDALSDFTDDAAFFLRLPTPRRIDTTSELGAHTTRSSKPFASPGSSIRQETRQRNGEEFSSYFFDEFEEHDSDPDADEAISPDVHAVVQAWAEAAKRSPDDAKYKTAPTAAFGRIRRRLSVASPDSPARKQQTQMHSGQGVQESCQRVKQQKQRRLLQK